jgi:hypothetical protein
MGLFHQGCQAGVLKETAVAAAISRPLATGG